MTARSTLRALYFQLIILLGSGIIGTGHHYYWIGAPEFWMALGSVFSALEVVPLTLLMVEAYGAVQDHKEGGIEFPYKAAFWFMIATGFLEPVRRGRARLPDQPADRELLPTRLVPDGGSRSRRTDGSLRHARAGAGDVLDAQHREAGVLEREVDDGRVLGPEHRADGHDHDHARSGGCDSDRI